MTKEQLQKGMELSSKITSMQETKIEISNKKAFLSFVFNLTDTINSEIASYRLHPISDILKKHERMILEEIDQEIERLTKEIEAL